MAELDTGIEEFSSRVIFSFVQNYTREGYTFNPSRAIAKLSGNVNKLVEYRPSFADSKQREEGYTRIVALPMSDPNLIEDPELLSPGNVGIFFGWQGFKVDSSERDATLWACAIMTGDDSKKFLDRVKEDPSQVYSLLKALNKGPIQMYDGRPMDIRPGKVVEILANSNMGGQQAETVLSAPFAEGYSPNP